MTKRKDLTLETVLWVIIILLVIVLLIITLGKIDFSEKVVSLVTPVKQKDDGSKAEKLKEKLRETKMLKARVENRASKYYFWSKAALAITYLLANIICGIIFWTGDLSQTLNLLLTYNQVLFILYALFMLVIPRRPLNVANLANAIKLKISNMLYSRYYWLDDEILRLENELNTYTNSVSIVKINS